MTCKDCLYYDFCNDYNEYPEYVQHCEQTTGTEFKCSHFKDKSRFIELPCKVGDTICGVFKNHKPPFIQQTKVEKIIVTEKGLKLKLARNSFYETSIASLGKTLFLTEEAAKAQIKELQEKQQ